MKKKIVGIFVCMLLFATIVSVTGSVKVLKSPLLWEVMDQSQELDDECVFISDFEWQEFIPTMDNLVRVEVIVVKFYDGSPDLKLSIEKPLGNVLTSKDVPANAIPSPPCGWVSFDVPDITLIPGESYFIKLTAPIGSEYGWAIRWGDPYPQGDSSNPPGDWAFRTFAEAETSPPDKPSITGTTSGKAGVEYEYTFTTTDPDGDDIYFHVSWGCCGPGDFHTYGPYESGEIAKLSHTYHEKGNYVIQAYARDIHGAESDWATLEVSMPKSKPYINTPFLNFLENFLENHPLMYQLLQRLLKL